VVSFTVRLLYSWGRGRGRSGEEKNPHPYRESNPGHPALSLVTSVTELPLEHKILL